MQILLPPSEGKTAPARGPRLDLTRLGIPGLQEPRAEVLTRLTRLCTGSRARARTALGLGPRQDDEIARNASLASSPTAPAIEVYSGVLYDALDVASLSAPARARLEGMVWVQSALYGIVTAGDPIAAYRLSADSTLPGLGVMARWWAPHLRDVLATQLAEGPVVDLRSGAYQAFWVPDAQQRERVLTVRVLTQSHSGIRRVVSHHNKATKGALVRALVQSRRRARGMETVASICADAGFDVELTPPTPRAAWQMDVILSA